MTSRCGGQHPTTCDLQRGTHAMRIWRTYISRRPIRWWHRARPARSDGARGRGWATWGNLAAPSRMAAATPGTYYRSADGRRRMRPFCGCRATTYPAGTFRSQYGLTPTYLAWAVEWWRRAKLRGTGSLTVRGARR